MKQDHVAMPRAMQGLFVLIGIALVVVGLNNSRPLAIVGGALIVLGVVGRVVRRKKLDS